MPTPSVSLLARCAQPWPAARRPLRPATCGTRRLPLTRSWTGLRSLAWAVAAVFAAHSAGAATLTWDSDASAGNGATDGPGTWDITLLNWFDGTNDIAWPNTVADTAIIGNGGVGDSLTLGVPITVGNLTFGALASGNYTLNSLTDPSLETLTIASGGTIAVNAAGTTTINPNVLMSTANGVLNITGPGSLVFASRVGTSNANNAAVVMNGGGTLTLDGTLDNTGLALTVNSGIALLNKQQAGGTRAVGNGTVINNGGVVRLAGVGGDQIFDGSAAATVTVNAGGLFDVNDRDEQIVGLVGVGTVDNTGAAAGILRLGGTAVNTTFSGVLQNSGAGTLQLIKSGGGTQTLTSANTYTGGTLITGGAFALGHSSALSTGTITFGGGAIEATQALTLGNNLVNNNNAATQIRGTHNITFSGALTNLTKPGNTNGPNFSNTNSTMTFGGPIYLSNDTTNGNFRFSSTGGNPLLGVNARVVVSGVIADNEAGGFLGTGNNMTYNFDGLGSSVLISGANTYGVTNGGTSTTILGGSNTGTIIIGQAAAFGISTVNLNGTKLSTDGAAYTLANNFTLSAGPSSYVGAANLTINGLLTNTSNGARLNNNGTGTLTFAGGISHAANSVLLGGTGNIVLGGAMTGSARITVRGPGSVAFTGSSTRTGDVFVDGGTLILDYSTNNTSKLTDTQALGINGGSVILTGGSHEEVVSQMSFFGGQGSATNITRTAGSSTLFLNNVARSVNGTTVNVGENNLVKVDNLNTDGVIGGWFTVARTDWAVNSLAAGDAPVIALTTYEAGGEAVWTAVSNALVSGSTALTTGRTVNTLKATTTGAGESLDLGGFNLLADLGGYLFTGADNYTVANGTLHNASAVDKIIFVNGAGTVTIGATVAGSGRTTKSGTGTLILTGANTQTGQVYVSEGVLQISSNANLGDQVSAQTLNIIGTGTLRADTTGGSFGLFNGVAGTNNRAVAMGNEGGTFEVTGTNAFTIAGVVSGGTTDAGGLNKTGPGTLVLTGANTYGSPTRILGGTVAVSTLANINTASGIGSGGTGQNAPQYLQINGGTLSWIGATAQSTNRNFTIGANNATLDASGTVPANVLTFSGSPVFAVANQAQSLTLGGTGGANATPNIYSGNLGSNGSGAVSLIKTGSGAWSVTNTANAFTGPVTVHGGTLSVNGAGTLGNGTALAINSTGTLSVNTGGVVARQVTVNAGGTLTGVGTVSGLTTVNSTGAINLLTGAAQTLTLGGGLTLNAGSVLGYDLGPVAGSDLLAITGGAYTASGVTTVNLNSLVGFGPGTYNLITGATGVNTANFTLGTGTSGSFGYAFGVAGSTLHLTVTANAPLTAFWRGDVDGVWSTNNANNTNWATDVTGATDTQAVVGFPTNVTFATTGAGNLTTTLGQDFIINTLTFSATPGGAVTVGGAHTLTVSSGITVEAGAAAATISTTQLALNGPQTWTNNSASLLSVSANVTGATTLTTAGTGVLQLSGTNIYSGGTTITAGTVRAASGAALGTGNVTMTGSTLEVNGQTLTTGLLAGSGGTVTNGAVGAATLTVSNPGTATFDGVLQNGPGTLALTKAGAGTQILTGTQTYTGGTLVSNGVLQLGNPATFTDASIVGDVVSNATFTLGNSFDQTFAGNVSGTGRLSKTGDGTLTLTGTNAAALGLRVGPASNGTVIIGALGALHNVPLDVQSGSLDVNGFSASLPSLNGATAGTIINNGATPATLTFAGAGTYLGTIQDGVSTVALVIPGGTPILGNNTTGSYSGGTTISGGAIVQIGNGTTTGSINNRALGTGLVTVTGATLRLQTQGGGAAQFITFDNAFTLGGGATLHSEEGTNTITGTFTVNNTGNVLSNHFPNKQLVLQGLLAGSGTVALNRSAAFGNTTNYVGIMGVGNTFSGTIQLNAAGFDGEQLLIGSNTALPAANVILNGNIPAGDVSVFGAAFSTTTAVFESGVTAPVLGSLAGNGHLLLQTRAFEQVSLTVGGNGTTTTYSGNLTDGGVGSALTKEGLGTLDLNGAQDYATLTTNAGTTNVNTTFVNTAATVNANATTTFATSQTLAALNIGAGAVVTLTASPPFAAVGDKGGMTAVVPEPGIIGLLLIGALGILGRRRRMA